MEDTIRQETKEFKEYTMGFGKVNLIALLMIIPITAMIFLPYVWFGIMKHLKQVKKYLMIIFYLFWLAGLLYMSLKLDGNVYISDHPEKMGFIRELD